MSIVADSTLSMHKAALAALVNVPDGTYSLETLKPVSFNSGFQVSFCCVGDEYTDDDYEFIVAMFREISSNGTAYVGIFDGTAEISFHIAKKSVAMKYGRLFNQICIWDWKNMDCIHTGGTGKR